MSVRVPGPDRATPRIAARPGRARYGDYGERAAGAYQTAREVPRSGLEHWREAIGRHLAGEPARTVLDVGAGTGAFATALHDWFGVLVVAIEPSTAMHSRIPRRGGVVVCGGVAEALPLRHASADAAWLSTVIHHFTDLPAAARELRRVLRPNAPVLIRGVFRGRGAGITLVRCFPETVRVLDTYPTIEQTTATFALAGFQPVALEAVPQQTAPDLRTFARHLRREADTLLRSLSDAEFACGMDRLRAAAAGEAAGGQPASPVVDRLDLLVLR